MEHIFQFLNVDSVVRGRITKTTNNTWTIPINVHEKVLSLLTEQQIIRYTRTIASADIYDVVSEKNPMNKNYRLMWGRLTDIPNLARFYVVIDSPPIRQESGRPQYPHEGERTLRWSLIVKSSKPIYVPQPPKHTHRLRIQFYSYFISIVYFVLMPLQK